MGYTYVDAEIANPASLASWEKLRFLVDTGALLSVVPRAVVGVRDD